MINQPLQQIAEMRSVLDDLDQWIASLPVAHPLTWEDYLDHLLADAVDNHANDSTENRP